MNNQNEWITVNEAAKVTGYNEEHVRRLLRDGEITGQKFGIVWQVNRESILSYARKAQNSADQRHGPKKHR